MPRRPPRRTTYPGVGVVPWDPSWPARFEAAAAGLRAVLGPAWQVEHIGSTSVPGLAAKPVIDVAVRVPEGGALTSVDRSLAEAGWVDAPTSVTTHDVRLRLSGHVRTHIAHFFPAAGWETADQRLFAAWLRDHPEDRDRYASLKTTLWEAGTWGSGYTAAKGDLVRDVTDRARAALGLPPRDPGGR